MKKAYKILDENVKPEEIAISYLIHEFKKIFEDIDDKKFFKLIKKSVKFMPKRFGAKPYEGFWMLVAGIAEGWKLKWVFRLLTDNGLKWQKEIRRLNDITLTGMNLIINPIIYEYCKRNPLKFRIWWNLHKNDKNNPILKMIKPYPARDFDPILLHEENAEFKVFDGMRRTLLSSIQKKNQIICYVGYRVEKGKPQISPDKLLFLKLLADGASKKDQNKVSKAMKIILNEICKQYKGTEGWFQNWFKYDSNQFKKNKSLSYKIINDFIKKLQK